MGGRKSGVSRLARPVAPQKLRPGESRIDAGAFRGNDGWLVLDFYRSKIRPGVFRGRPAGRRTWNGLQGNLPRYPARICEPAQMIPSTLTIRYGLQPVRNTA